MMTAQRIEELHALVMPQGNPVIIGGHELAELLAARARAHRLATALRRLLIAPESPLTRARAQDCLDEEEAPMEPEVQR